MYYRRSTLIRRYLCDTQMYQNFASVNDTRPGLNIMFWHQLPQGVVYSYNPVSTMSQTRYCCVIWSKLQPLYSYLISEYSMESNNHSTWLQKCSILHDTCYHWFRKKIKMCIRNFNRHTFSDDYFKEFPKMMLSFGLYNMPYYKTLVEVIILMLFKWCKVKVLSTKDLNYESFYINFHQISICSITNL